jgi:hypothetical protein
MWNNIIKNQFTETTSNNNQMFFQQKSITEIDYRQNFLEKTPGTCTAECQIITDSYISQLNDIAEIIEIEPQTYNIDMDNESPIPCPVSQCPYNTTKRHQMRSHLRNMHNIDTIIINEEGILPRCSKCGIFQYSVREAHQSSATCIKYSQLRLNREIEKSNTKIISSTFLESTTKK